MFALLLTACVLLGGDALQTDEVRAGVSDGALGGDGENEVEHAHGERVADDEIHDSGERRLPSRAIPTRSPWVFPSHAIA